MLKVVVLSEEESEKQITMQNPPFCVSGSFKIAKRNKEFFPFNWAYILIKCMKINIELIVK